MGLEHLMAQAAAKKVEQQFHDKCKKDRHGNPYVVGNSLFRGFSCVFLPIGVAVLMICIFSPSSYVLKGIDPGNTPLFMYCVSILLICIAWCFLRRKAILKNDSLVVCGSFTKRSIPLDELRMAALRQRPKVVRSGSVSFATDTKDARILFLNSTGGKDFIAALCNRIHTPLPEDFSKFG